MKNLELKTTSKELASIAEKAVKFYNNSKSKATIRAYKSDWKQYETWCEKNNFNPLPATPQTIVLYITYLSNSYKTSSVKRKLACISEAHRISEAVNPVHSVEVENVLSGIVREFGCQKLKKKALRLSDIRQIISQLPNTLIGIRDKALLLVGIAGGFRRSELVNLTIEDVEFSNSGMTIRIRKNKTDQNGEGYTKTIGKGRNTQTCPVTALRNWINSAQINSGKIFRSISKGGIVGIKLSSNAIAVIVKKCTKLIGLNSTDFAGHSLRSGFVTEAKESGVPDVAIMKMTHHKTIQMISEYYQGYEAEQYSISGKIGF